MAKKYLIHQTVAEKHPEIAKSEYEHAKYPWGEKKKLFRTDATDKQLKKLGLYRWNINGNIIWGYVDTTASNKR